MAKRGSIADKVKLDISDDFFSMTDPRNADDKTICDIPLCDLYPFKNHPFKVKDDDDKMIETMDSISKQGVLNPIIVRPIDGQDTFEIVAGHRRVRACELLGIEKIPSIIKKLDDEESTIVMVDSNIQREELLYSEKAFAYKMKLEAIKVQGKRNDLTCAQVGHKLNGKKSIEIIADESSDSRNQIKRYIRLTYLIKELLDMTDEKTLPFTTAVELSYLTDEEQYLVLVKMDEIRKPSLIESKEFKAQSLDTDGGLTAQMVESILLPDFSQGLQGTENTPEEDREVGVIEYADLTETEEIHETDINEETEKESESNNELMESIEPVETFFVEDDTEVYAENVAQDEVRTKEKPLKRMLRKYNVLTKYFKEDVQEEELEEIFIRLLEQHYKTN